MTIAVLGAGSWGTTLADLLARKGLAVRLWAYEPEVAQAINETRENPIYLAGVSVHRGVVATNEAAEAVRGATECVLCASPSHTVREVLSQIAGSMPVNSVLASATKGIEMDTLALMSEVAAAVLPRHQFVALSGPSFAREVSASQLTAVVAASTDPGAARQVQQLFATNYFRVYSNQDVIGTELGGSLKNVIAIAAGILEGLRLGDNARAALITRGLAEMARLGDSMGADSRTFAGLAGMGDLILTSCGELSRNRRLGVALANGVSLQLYRKEHRSVAEGINTAKAAVDLARRHRVELPIATQVAAILFEGKPARQAIAELMDRTLKPEQWT